MSEAFYESDRAVAEYLLFHYGTAEQILPWPFGPVSALHFPVRCVADCLETWRLPPEPTALDLGCAVGRSSFELARHCIRVVGIDASQRFIETAKQLQERGVVKFALPVEGAITEPCAVLAPAGIDRSRVEFRQGDAMDLPDDLGPFDVILMANLIDRLPEPARCLRQLPRLVRPGGQLIITSPYTWLEEYTPRHYWVGGYVDDQGRAVRTLDALQQLLDEHFRLTGTKDLPFLIREHARKYQWSVAQGSLWERKLER